MRYPSTSSTLIDLMETSFNISLDCLKNLNGLNELSEVEVYEAFKGLFIVKKITTKELNRSNKFYSEGLLAVIMMSQFLPNAMFNSVLTDIAIKLEEENKKIEEKYDENIKYFSSEDYLSQFQSDIGKNTGPPMPAFIVKIEKNSKVIGLIEDIIQAKYFMENEVPGGRLKLLDFDKKHIYSLTAILSRAVHKLLRKELAEEDLDQVSPDLERVQKFIKISKVGKESLVKSDIDIINRDRNITYYIQSLWQRICSLGVIPSQSKGKLSRIELANNDCDESDDDASQRIRKFRKISEFGKKSLANPNIDLIKRGKDDPSYMHSLWANFFSKGYAKSE
jgi:hypothetical protein